MAAASSSLASRASLVAHAGSSCSMPGAVSDSTATSTPAASMAAMPARADVEQLLEKGVG